MFTSSREFCQITVAMILYSIGLKHAHLADDVPVGETDNHPVLGCVVLVLILNDKALAGKVVSLSL